MMDDGGTSPSAMDLDSSSVKDIAIPPLSARHKEIQSSSKKEIRHLSSYRTMTKDGTVPVPVRETEVKDLSPSRQLVKDNSMVPLSEGKLTLSPSRLAANDNGILPSSERRVKYLPSLHPAAKNDAMVPSLVHRLDESI